MVTGRRRQAPYRRPRPGTPASQRKADHVSLSNDRLAAQTRMEDAQWKEDYNRDGTASVQALSRLAHMSRLIVGYQLRSADAHLVLFALTRDAPYLYRAVQVAGSRSPAGRLPNGADPGDSIDAAIPL